MSEAVPVPEVEAAPVQAGRQLAAARESCGLSVADVAHQLKLSPSQVEALEADNYARLPGTVFVRGFIRNYARLVKLDPALLLADAERHLPSSTHSPELPPSTEIPFPSGREFNWQKYAIAGLILLVPIVIFEFYRDDTTAGVMKSNQIALPAPRVVAVEPAAEAGVTEPPVAAASDVLAKAVPTGAAADGAEKIATGKPVNIARAAVVERKPGDQLIKLRFERESWVEIRDRSGHKIFSQLSPAGTAHAVSGQPPLTLVVGNAAGVRLTYNDQLVDLAPHIKVDVARLTLE